MVSTGSFSDPNAVIGFASEFSAAAVSAGLYLQRWGPAPCRLALGGMQFWADTAGSGVGYTVIDVLINGTSVWTNAAQRPTLAAASTGGFTMTRPTQRTLKKGDRLDVQVATIPSVAGHANVRFCIALQNATTPY